MIPNVGDITKLNPDFIDYHKSRVDKGDWNADTSWAQECRDTDLVILKVTDVNISVSDPEVVVYFYRKGNEQDQLCVQVGKRLGRFSRDNSNYPIVFLSPRGTVKNSNYCTCGGPEKEYIGFNSKTMICKNCGKDKKC